MRVDIQGKAVLLRSQPKRVKKITGTRFAAILGLNPWSTPFEAWCDMTGVYKIPFEGNKFTNAGAAIEPIVIDYLDRKYFFGRGLLKSADQWFGKTKDQLHYDHFPKEAVFGGMWDARTKTGVYELKTTKRSEDWMKNGVFTPPEYYKLQGALYAYLMGLDEFRMVVSFLEEKDYDQPELYTPAPENTIMKKYSLQAEYPNFESHINYCLGWREKHVAGCVSPGWDDKRDADIVKALTTAHVVPHEGGDERDPVSVIISEIEPLQAKIDAMEDALAEDSKRLEELKKQLKPELQARMKDSDKKIVLDGSAYVFEVSRSQGSGIDTDRLKADGIYDTYRKTGFTYKLNMKRKEDATV